MKQIFNKPRVFLSHSKKDEVFIRRIYDDLQRCHIAPWLDVFEIRTGKPWLDQIFESGIPTCDSVLVYMTANSIGSPVVKKEIDASIVTQLSNQKMVFLPYVSEEQVRNELRADIQALHVPVWNTDNYSRILPTVVAEIWHSYLERTIDMAVNEEKTKRLALELEVQKKRAEGGIFTDAENRDFEYIKNQLNYNELMGAVISKKDTNVSKTIKFDVNILSLIPQITGKDHAEYYDQLISTAVCRVLRSQEGEKCEIKTLADIDITDELMVFGLVERQKIQRQPLGRKSMLFVLPDYDYCYTYTPKMERFKYWLAYNELYPVKIQIIVKEFG